MKRWIVLAAFALPSVAGAQGVRGTVVDQASRQPIPGAVVLLVDANDAVVGRDLTSESGTYRVAAPRAGIYRLRTMRIGFRPVVSSSVTASDGTEVTFDLAIESVPVSLAAVKVERQANCPARQDVSQAYNAWNEVATALQAALLSSRARGTTATTVAYDRWTEAGNDVILRQGANVRDGLPGQPWRSVGADSLHRAGFVVREANGWYTFHAPDLDVLLSDTFLQDHCLSLHGVDKGEIALEFTPSRDRGRIAEIRGFVWLDATSLELRRLQFRYVNVLRQYEQADAGGDLEFLRLRNGVWIVSRWQVRMPTAFKPGRSDSYGDLRGTPEVRATEVKTTGGDVLRVVQNGDIIFAVPPRSFEGKVLDSATNRPLSGARVTLAGTSYSTVTNELGGFRVDDVLPGAYTVRVFTPELDSLVTSHQAPVLMVQQARNIEVRVPNGEQMLTKWCGPDPRGDRRAVGMLFGVVTSARGLPVQDGDVTLDWTEGEITSLGVTQRENTAKATTDVNGIYRICGVPIDHRVMLSTEFDADAVPTAVRIEAGSRMRRYDIALDANGKRIVDAAVKPGLSP